MNIAQTISVRGVWTGFMLSKDIKEGDPIIGRLRDVARGKVGREEGQKIIRDLKAKKIITKVVKKHNLIPITGRNVLARLLTGDTTYSGEVNYIALGDGNTAFNNNSTQLNNEVFRKLVSDAAFDDNIAYIDVFVASGDTPDDTYTEAGAFIDGTGAADSGQAFSLVVQNFVKSGSMFISLQITLSQA